jgi:integrase
MARQSKGTLYKRGKNWCLLYYVNGKRFRVTMRNEQGETITNRKEAEIAADRELRPILAKDTTERRRMVAAALSTAEDEAKRAEEITNERQAREEAERNKLPIADAWDRYPYTETTRGAVTRPLKPDTVSDLASHWTTFAAWAEEQGIRAVEDITKEHAAAFSRHLRKEFSANRHNKIIQTCRVVCRLSGLFEDIPDPFAKVKRYSVKSEEVHRANLEPEERRNLTESAPGEYRRFFLLGIFTGLRLGDCATLQWADIRMGEEAAHIIRLTEKTGREVSFTVHHELREELARTPPEERAGAVCPELAKLYTYRNQEGKTTRRGDITKTIRRIFEGCGLETRAEAGEGRKRAASVRGFHSFRVAFVTDCARVGVPLGLVQEWLGHSSPETTRIHDRWDTSREGGRVVAALPSMVMSKAPEPKALPEGPAALEVETERERLRALADSLPSTRVRELLAIADTWARG